MLGGAIYEYARESRKLRCLLTLMNPKRPREDWEMARPAIVDGKQPDPSDPLARPRPLPCSFNGLNEHAGERALGGFLYCLRDLADYLADNISFAELFRAKRDELERAFGGLNELSRAKGEKAEFSYFLPIFDAVEVATRSETEQWPTVLETISHGEQRLIYGEACSEVIALRVHWGGFNNSQIGKAMQRFARDHRPRNEACKERKRTQGQKIAILAALKGLSVMRIRKKLGRGKQWKRLELVAKVCGYESCKKEWADYQERCNQGHGDEPMSNAAKVEMSNARSRALSVFQSLFPTETPSNW